ncbi:hypothetical protein DZF91_22705, partial [Actinomadura logoneensis]
RAAQERAAQDRAAQRSEALKAGAALFHQYYAAVISRHGTRPGHDTSRVEVSAARAAAPVATGTPDAAGRPVLPPGDRRPPAARGGETDPVRGPPSSTDL